MGGSNVCFADKKEFLLPDEVHLSRLISFKQPLCRAERVRGSGHILCITQLAGSMDHDTCWSIELFIYEAWGYCTYPQRDLALLPSKAVKMCMHLNFYVRCPYLQTLKKVLVVSVIACVHVDHINQVLSK